MVIKKFQKKSNSRFKSDIKIKLLPDLKRSQGHVEVILSMILFIGALIFIFVFLNPAIKKKEDINIDKIQEKIINNISSTIGKLAVVTESVGDCYSLDEVNDDYGNNFIEVRNDERSYTIYYGDFFDYDFIEVISCPLNFKLGSYTEEKIIVYEKIQKLKNNYNNYNLLKRNLGVDDFSFKVKNIDGNIIEELSVSDEKIPINVDVASKDITIRVMNNKAEISEYILNLKTWR